jgi:hypothetical protein
MSCALMSRPSARRTRITVLSQRTLTASGDKTTGVSLEPLPAKVVIPGLLKDRAVLLDQFVESI